MLLHWCCLFFFFFFANFAKQMFCKKKKSRDLLNDVLRFVYNPEILLKTKKYSSKYNCMYSVKLYVKTSSTVLREYTDLETTLKNWVIE